MPTAIDLLRRQLDEGYRFIRPRLEGLSDEEFFWGAGAGMLDGSR